MISKSLIEWVVNFKAEHGRNPERHELPKLNDDAVFKAIGPCVHQPCGSATSSHVSLTPPGSPGVASGRPKPVITCPDIQELNRKGSVGTCGPSSEGHTRHDPLHKSRPQNIRPHIPRDKYVPGARITSSRNETSSADQQPAYTFKRASACHTSSTEGRNTCMLTKSKICMALKPSSRLRNYAPELAQAESAESSGIALEDAPENDTAPDVMLRLEARTGETVTPSKNNTFSGNGQAVCAREPVIARHLSAPVVCTISTPTKAWAGCLRGGNGLKQRCMAAGPSSRPDIIPPQVEPAESPESSGISLEDVPGLDSPAPAMNPQPEAYTGMGYGQSTDEQGTANARAETMVESGVALKSDATAQEPAGKASSGTHMQDQRRKRRRLNPPTADTSAAPVKVKPPALSDKERGKQAKSTRSKNGVRQNFVRNHMKGPAGSQKKFCSKHGRKRPAYSKKRFPRSQPRSLPQAGDGAEFTEGSNNAKVICYKCGGRNHWARDCKVGRQEEDSEKAATKDVESILQEQGITFQGDGGEAAAPGDYSESALTAVLNRVFGHKAFRGSQLHVIQCLLQGQSALAIMPTGMGKSICYQLPAVLQRGTVLVISPLLALMKDQLAKLPRFLPAAMLSSNQSASQSMQILEDLKDGKLRILFISPERVGTSQLRMALQPLLPLPLVCVDEAHCMSEWGHNFRSAYFRLGHLLAKFAPSRSVLALTATATLQTQKGIAAALGIPSKNIFKDSALRCNIRLHAQHLQGPAQLGGVKSNIIRMVRQHSTSCPTVPMIVYTTFQAQADDFARFFSSNGVTCSSYHAGRSMQDREVTQQEFSTGRLKVIVATIAFGMGMDISNVRTVIHLNLPRSLEDYVQQVGRAGRDGAEAKAHAYVLDGDFYRLRSLAHSDLALQSAIEALLQSVLSAGVGTFVIIPVEQSTTDLDMKEEVIDTLLSYLEAGDEKYVINFPKTGESIKISFYNSNPKELAEQHNVIQTVLHICPKPRRGHYNVKMQDLANEARMSPSEILGALKRLAVEEELSFEVSLKKAFSIQIVQQPSDQAELASQLARRHVEVIQRQVRRLDAAYCALVAAASLASQERQEKCLRNHLAAFFEREEDQQEERGLLDVEVPLRSPDKFLAADVKTLLRTQDPNLTPQAVARIFHGISSPAFPADRWASCGFWDRYNYTDFMPLLGRIADILGEATKKT
eukprot:jgi/Botrbrau1/9057/Bobra.0376s0031.1